MTGMMTAMMHSGTRESFDIQLFNYSIIQMFYVRHLTTKNNVYENTSIYLCADYSIDSNLMLH